MVRLNTMREELDRRFDTMGKFIAQPTVLEMPVINSYNARIVLVGSDPKILRAITCILPPVRRPLGSTSLIKRWLG